MLFGPLDRVETFTFGISERMLESKCKYAPESGRNFAFDSSQQIDTE